MRTRWVAAVFWPHTQPCQNPPIDTAMKSQQQQQERRYGLRSISALADEWDVSQTTIRALIRRGELTHVRVGQRVRFREEDVQRYLGRSP